VTLGTHVIRLRGPWSLEFRPDLSSTGPNEIGSGICDERADGTTGDIDDSLVPLASATSRSIRVPIDLRAVVPNDYVGRIVLWRNFNCPTGLDESTRVGLRFDDLPMRERLREIRLGDEVLWRQAQGNPDSAESCHRSIVIELGSALARHNRLGVVWHWPRRPMESVGASDARRDSGYSQDGVAPGDPIPSLEFHGASLVIDSSR